MAGRSDKGKAVRREYNKRWYQLHKDEQRAKAKAEYWLNRDKHIAASVEYHRANRQERIEYKKQHRKAKAEVDKDYYRKQHLKFSYGITLEEYQNLCESQNGRCAICGKESKLVVDHSHETKLVRKLLCGNCNCMLGQSFDNPVILIAAANYLMEN